jgi:hypothetical protein
LRSFSQARSRRAGPFTGGFRQKWSRRQLKQLQRQPRRRQVGGTRCVFSATQATAGVLFAVSCSRIKGASKSAVDDFDTCLGLSWASPSLPRSRFTRQQLSLVRAACSQAMRSSPLFPKTAI